MTALYITIDTELSAGLFQKYGADGFQKNFDHSIAGKTPSGDYGVFYQMDVFDRYGMKAVFFVDPMPALIWGTDAIADIVGPIVARGHDVQLHLHPEWLQFARDANPLSGRTGKNIKDFSYEDQVMLLQFAKSALMKAGAPEPVAFRAGNYGANDDTLRALQAVGIRYDSSVTPGFARSDCAISLPSSCNTVTEYHGVIEVPISYVSGQKDNRHAQLTALSSHEICAALRYSRDYGAQQFTLVSHSFELLSRDRMSENKILTRRFENFCRKVASMEGIYTATYSNYPPAIENGAFAAILPHNPVRTIRRLAEQAISNALYGSS
jgi:peptidoglycan/xylan/chitin deacetylase (PgdA/CDA1 family)